MNKETVMTSVKVQKELYEEYFLNICQFLNWSINSVLIENGLIINMIVSCIDYFYDNETTYRDFKKEEAKELIQSLTLNDFKKLEKFFQDIPVLSHEDIIQCPKCKYDQVVSFNGLKDFF